MSLPIFFRSFVLFVQSPRVMDLSLNYAALLHPRAHILLSQMRQHFLEQRTLKCCNYHRGGKKRAPMASAFLFLMGFEGLLPASEKRTKENISRTRLSS
jgi:hypothetical protein